MTIFGLRPGVLVGFYASRVRNHPVQEIFAGVGIAVGVALLFGVQVANTSLTRSADQIVHALIGDATLQLSARSSNGFDGRLADRAARLPGVKRSALLLRERVTIVGPLGRRSVELVGGTPDLPRLGGALTGRFGSGAFALTAGIGLPAGVADAIGAKADKRVRIFVGGRVHRMQVGVILGKDSIGPLADSQAAVTSLPLVQTLTDNRGRVSQLLIVPKPGATEQLTRDLQRLAGDRVSVASADAELGLLQQAAKPNDQSTGLFALIAATVGFLFAANAMLVTTPERRRFIADLRLQGYDQRQVATILGFEALALGTAASLAGIVLGDALSRLVFHDVPEYLAFAFPIGTQRVVEPSTIVYSLAGGLLAALLASARPLLDLRPRLPINAVFQDDGEPGEGLTATGALVMLACGLALIAGTTAVLLMAPSLTIIGGVLLAAAAMLVTPAVFSVAARYAERLGDRSRRLKMLSVAMMELGEARTRAIALAAIGALAIYGSVAVEGTHSDLLRGLDRNTNERFGTADLWVTTGRIDLTTDPFPATRGQLAAISAARGIADLRAYRGSLLDSRGRRLWVIGRPTGDHEMIPPSQFLDGNLSSANERLRRGGWATISNNLAKDLDVGIGDKVALPSPGGRVRYRVAAITTNLGWVPGAVIVNSDDYARAWGDEPAALEIDLASGVTPAEGKQIVQEALGLDSALLVQTAGERQAQYRELTRQGLARLDQIATLLLIAAALAMASAMGTAVWERRRRISALKVQGFDHRQLWRALMEETGFVLAVGSVVGAAAGVYGHVLASRYLEVTTGYPTPFVLGVWNVITAVALVVGIALAVAAFPGYAAAQVPARASFQE